MIGHYIIHSENILVFIILLFLVNMFIYFERLIESTIKRALSMSLCENVSVDNLYDLKYK